MDDIGAREKTALNGGGQYKFTKGDTYRPKYRYLKNNSSLSSPSTMESIDLRALHIGSRSIN